MMITEEEKEGIIAETIERLLVVLPEVVGNLMTANVMYSDLNKKFYSDNPDFTNHKDIVTQVVAKVESENPLDGYDTILKNALPIIKEHIKLKGNTCMGLASKPFLPIQFDETDNGAL